MNAWHVYSSEEAHNYLIVPFCIVLRGSKGLVGEQASQASLWMGVTQTSASLLTRSGITAIFLRSICLAGWSAPEETSQTPPGVSLSEPFTSLILIITMEPNSPKKIQLAVPLFQSQIAPEAAEQVSGTGWGPALVYKYYRHTYLLLIESFSTF